MNGKRKLIKKCVKNDRFWKNLKKKLSCDKNLATNKRNKNQKTWKNVFIFFPNESSKTQDKLEGFFFFALNLKQKSHFKKKFL